MLFSSEPNRESDAQAEFAQVKALDPSLMPANAPARQRTLANRYTVPHGCYSQDANHGGDRSAFPADTRLSRIRLDKH